MEVSHMKNNPLAHNRLFLYLTEFLAGMCVMGVEIGASRLLAPYFSSSQIVWTIIIGTIMVAMAIGNFLGRQTRGQESGRDEALPLHHDRRGLDLPLAVPRPLRHRPHQRASSPFRDPWASYLGQFPHLSFPLRPAAYWP
jgi:hypothetical protein